MTRDQDIERVLERWFTEGPTQMPDRLFEFVDHIDRLPQRRRARLMTRFVAMHSTIRLAAAAVVIMIVGVTGAIFLTRPASVGTVPSPTPSAVPSASAAPPAYVPAQVISKWLAIGTRTSPGLATLTIGADRLSVQDTNGPVVSTASVAGKDRLALKLSRDNWGCKLGDEGTYTFSVSPDGNTLTLTPADDACSTRSDILAGDWARNACQDVAGGCLKALQPGTYTSGFFNAMSSSSSAYTYGQFSYTVPAGWANTEDWPGNYVLNKPSDPPNTGIYLFRDVVPHSQDESCPETAAPGVERSPKAFADWLSTLPGLVTTEPVAVRIGGLDGVMIDLSVAPDWTHTCPYSEGKPLVSTFVDSNPGTGYDWNIGAGNVSRYIFLRQPDGRSLLIEIGAPDKATWDALVAQAMPIVDTFHFKP